MSLDWQFVLVTLAALWGAWVLLKPLLPAKRREHDASDIAGGPACPRCASGDACGKARTQPSEPKLVTLGSRK